MKYKHALFLNPYIESTATSIMGLFPPTGLEYVATSAKDLVGKISLVDLRHEKKLCDPENLLKFVRDEGVDVICVSVTWNRQYEEIIEFLKLMPDGIPLIVGGYKATERVEEIFNRCPKVDIIVRGEGEETIKQLVKDEPLENILGISYRKDGKIMHNKNRPLPPVDNLTPPDRRLRRTDYRMTFHQIRVTNLTYDTVLSSRGCPFTCKFCTFSLNPLGQKRDYSARNVDSVIKEIEGIKSDVVLFSDDNFFTDVKRSEEICDKIIARGIKKRFIAQARIDIARHPKVMEKIVKAGFKMLLIGVESPHDWVLKQFNKGFDQATIRKCFKVFQKYPIYYHGYFIYGNIGETEEEMYYIPHFAREIGLDSITVHKLRIEQFSPLKELAEKTAGYHVTDRGEIYSDNYSHAALKKIGRKLKFTFYTGPHMLHIGFKIVRINFIRFQDVLSFLLLSPILLKKVIFREMEKNRLGDSLKRIFVNNSSYK